MTYTENLNAAVVASLQSQDLDVRSIYSTRNAAMFTLYYRQGATISASEKLTLATKDSKHKAHVKKQAVDDNNYFNNLAASAAQANLYNKQAITNTAVCAANVQVAATAVVRLAGDIGNIYSILQAADKNTEMYSYTDKVRQHINATAYLAETVSQQAMQAAILSSEVASGLVQDKCTATGKLMGNLLAITSADFDTASQVAAADNAAFAAASVNESMAEGALEDVAIDFEAATKAYNSANYALNLGLKIGRASAASDTTYVVSFREIKKLFAESADPAPEYYMMVAKESKKLTFSLTSAENIYSNRKANPQQILHVTGRNLGGLYEKVDFYNVNALTEPPSTSMEPLKMLDTDGHVLALGTPYVVFIMAVYDADYKREINNFSDFLSAGSKKLVLTQHIKPVDGGTVKPADEVDLTITSDANPDETTSLLKLQQKTYEIQFTSDEANVTHRCIFLPIDGGVPTGLMTKQSFYEWVNGPEKALLKEEIAELKQQIKYLEIQLPELKTSVQAAKKEVNTAKLSLERFNLKHEFPKGADLAEQKLLQQAFDAAEGNLDVQTRNYETAQQEKNDAEALIAQLEQPIAGVSQIEFFFNTAIAEQVSPSNYTVATQTNIKLGLFKVLIDAATTDNFGNLLVNKAKYLPLILTVTDSDNPANYTNALSDPAITTPFVYEELTNLLF